MAAQATLRALLAELLDCKHASRMDEAQDAWTNLEKHIKYDDCAAYVVSTRVGMFTLPAARMCVALHAHCQACVLDPGFEHGLSWPCAGATLRLMMTWRWWPRSSLRQRMACPPSWMPPSATQVPACPCFIWLTSCADHMNSADLPLFYCDLCASGSASILSQVSSMACAGCCGARHESRREQSQVAVSHVAAICAR